MVVFSSVKLNPAGSKTSKTRPDSNMKEQLQDADFLALIIPEMVGLGFAHISTVTVDQNRDGFRYHVEANEARSTTFLFHTRGTAFAVALQYTEYTDRDGYNGHWKVLLFLQFKDYGTLLRENRHWLDAPDHETRGDMPLLGSTPFKLHGFERSSGRTEGDYWLVEFSSRRVAELPNLVAKSVEAGYKILQRYLTRTFDRLCLSDIVPYYTFGSEYGSVESGRLEQYVGHQLDTTYINMALRTPKRRVARMAA